MRRKRVFDVVVAIIGLTVFSPLLAGVALAIRVEDGQDVFFFQERVGRGGRRFQVYKFRTMRDGQVTRVGRWLRPTGLDEVPQFINVLKGDMSVVGPRPLTHADLERLHWVGAPRQALRPGITGPAQLLGGRGKEHSARVEDNYARQGSLRLDAEVVALSFLVNIIGKQRVKRMLVAGKLGRRTAALG